MEPEEFEIFSKVAEDMGHEYGPEAGIRIHKYTGRGMKHECVAVVMPEIHHVIEFSARVAIVTGDERPLLGAKLDTLGNHLVVYWPESAWIEQEKP